MTVCGLAGGFYAVPHSGPPTAMMGPMNIPNPILLRVPVNLIFILLVPSADVLSHLTASVRNGPYNTGWIATFCLPHRARLAPPLTVPRSCLMVTGRSGWVKSTPTCGLNGGDSMAAIVPSPCASG